MPTTPWHRSSHSSDPDRIWTPSNHDRRGFGQLMADITLDVVQSVQGTAVFTLTIPAFATSGKDRAAFVTAGMSDASNWTVTSVARSAGSEVFTNLWSITRGTYFNSYGGYYVNPSKGVGSVLVSWSGNCDEACAGVVCVNNADPSTIAGQTGGGTSGTSSSVTLTRPTQEYWIIDGVYVWSATITPDADLTSRWEQAIIGATYGGSAAQKGPADENVSWSWSSSNVWVAGTFRVGPMRRWLLSSSEASEESGE